MVRRNGWLAIAGSPAVALVFWLVATALVWEIGVGPYARIRHPQYAAFILIMSGFLFQWPTLVTLAMVPVLVVLYVRLAHREESEALPATDRVPRWTSSY